MRNHTDTLKFLFLDNRPLEYFRGFARHMRSPVKYGGNPILEPDRPWEFNRVMLYGSVLREPRAGLYRMWYTTRENDLNYGKMNGNWDIELAWSRDGYCWHRPFQGEDFIPRGARGEWDSELISPASSPLFLEDEIRFYYGACANQHGDAYQSKRFCVGAASLEPDRFSALVASESGGELMTRPFASSTSRLFVNAEAKGGEVRAALLNDAAMTIPGYGFEDCVPLQENGLRLPVRWKSDPSPGLMLRKPIRLALRAAAASVYSVTFADDEGAAKRYAEWGEIQRLDPMKDLGQWGGA